MINRLDLKVGFGCNNNCIFCAQAHKREFGDKSTEKIKEDLKDNSIKCNEVVFTGGEPIIRDDFLELVAFAKKQGYKLIQIQSNGRKFSELKFCLAAINAGANSFSIAVHGHNADLHDSLTQAKGGFEETKEGIKNLVELGQPIATNTVITKQNYPYLPEISEMLSLLSPDQVQFAFVHAIGNAGKNFDMVVPKINEVIPFLKKAINTLIDNDIEPRIEAVPACIVPEFENYLTEKYLPDTKVLDADSNIEHWHIIRKNFAKKKFVQCDDCKFNLCCEGTWKEYPERFGSGEFKPVLPIPNEVIIELTKKCNLNCSFCFNNHENSQNKELKELGKLKIFRLIDGVKGNTNAIRFTGGEPLLRGDLKEILAYTHSNNIYTILNTNGTLLNEENISILEHVDDLLISFHDISQQVLKSRLFRLIRQRNKHIKLRACTTLTKENIQNLDAFYGFMQFQPVDDWFLLRQIPNKDNKEPLTKEETKSMINQVAELNKKYRRKVMIANAIPFCVVDKEKAASVCIGGKNDSGHSRIYINSQGRIFPDYFSTFVLGDITNEDVNELWLGSKMSSIRNMNYLPKGCVVCDYNVSCKGGLSSLDYTDYLI